MASRPSGKETRVDQIWRAIKNNRLAAVVIVGATVVVAVRETYTALPDSIREFAERRLAGEAGNARHPQTGWVFVGYLDKDNPTQWAEAEGPRVKLEKVSPGIDRPHPFREGDIVRPFRDLPQVIADYRTKGTMHQFAPPWHVTEVIRKSEDYTGALISPKETYSVMEVSVSALSGHDAAVWLRVTRAPMK